MKKLSFFLILSLLMMPFGNDVAAQPQKKLRIGVAGIQIENSVFMPNRQAIVGSPLSLPDYLSKDSTMGKAAIWLPSLMGRSGGRGPVTRESYELFVKNALEIIRANMPYDAFWFYNHGACSVDGVNDPEGDFMERVRGVIGNDVLVTTTMDLHGNVSWRVALYSDIITTYRKA
ncbi:MAG: M81 family metallopeptidase, partial [Bacteroidales bacterium]